MSEATTNNWFKRLFIDNAKGALCRCSGGGSGDGEIDEDMIATDEEVNDVLDDAFDTEVYIPEDNIATNKEVVDTLDAVFNS